MVDAPDLDYGTPPDERLDGFTREIAEQTPCEPEKDEKTVTVIIDNSGDSSEYMSDDAMNVISDVINRANRYQLFPFGHEVRTNYLEFRYVAPENFPFSEFKQAE